MSKKKTFIATYSILVNGEEFTREVPITGVKNKLSAEKKLRKLCSTTIHISKLEESSI
ncbi:MAG: hypothetical protein ACOYN4_10675 [Bacteroidales bacterium]|jgi:hypothetical protein